MVENNLEIMVSSDDVAVESEMVPDSSPEPHNVHGGISNGCLTPVTDPDNLALLAAMDEANRQLEADDRSMSLLPSPQKNAQLDGVSDTSNSSVISSSFASTTGTKTSVDDSDTQQTIQELCSRIQQLETLNQQLSDGSNTDLEMLREELIACKVREAESDLLLKELKLKILELEKMFEKHKEIVGGDLKTGKANKLKLQELSAELMSAQLRETAAAAELTEVKQETLQLEAANRVYERQLKRLEEDKEMLSAVEADWKTLETQLNEHIHDLERQLYDIKSLSQEETMMSRIKDAENAQVIAEMKQRISDLEIQNQELLTAETLHMSSIDATADQPSDIQQQMQDADDIGSDDDDDDDDDDDEQFFRQKLTFKTGDLLQLNGDNDNISHNNLTSSANCSNDSIVSLSDNG